ncbi:MAG: hypothetical protein GX974_01645 [Clostridiales bacterium]|nr:hypothetical protein [Clostridiales bacterium]
MLTECINIFECEQILLSQLDDNIQFIGQVKLSLQDYIKLKEMISEYIKHEDNLYILKNLINTFPACMAFFLVYKGVWGYSQGNYWSSVRRVLGHIDTITQTELGKGFIQFIKNKGLTTCEIESTNRYVTPILIHGGIPQKCLNEFFSEILLHFDNMGIISENQAINYLVEYRQTYHYKAGLGRQLNDIEKEYKEAIKEHREFKELIDRKNTLKKSLANNFYHIFRLDYKDDYNVLITKLNISALESKHIDYTEQIQIYKKLKAERLNLKKYIDFGKEKRNIKPKFLIGLAGACTFLGISILLNNLWILIGVLPSFIPIWEGITNHIKQDKVNRKRKEYSIEVENRLDKVIIDMELIRQQVQSIFGQFPIPPGYWEAHAKEIIANLRLLRKELINYRRIKMVLAQRIRNIASRCDVKVKQMDSFAHDIILDLQLKRIKSLESSIEELKYKINSIQIHNFYVEEPILRFVIYGGEWASRWVGHLILLLNNNELISTDSDRDSILPDRVLRAFNTWISNIKKERKKKRSFDYRELEKFAEPLLVLDPVLQEIKISIGDHNIKADSRYKEGFNLRIDSDDRPQGISIPMRGYRNDGDTITITKIDVDIYNINTNYKIALVSGDIIIREWEVFGISPAIPFLMFKENGMRVLEPSFPKTRLWFLLPNELKFPQEIRVLEHIQSVKFAHNCHLALVDLTNIVKLSILDRKSDKVAFNIQSIDVIEPYLSGTKPLTEVSSLGEPIYTQGIPQLIIPFENKHIMLRQVLTISRGADRWDTRKSYRLKDLKNIRINNQSNEIEILLDTPQLMGKAPVGWYEVSIGTEDKKRYRFPMVVLTDLIIIHEPWLSYHSEGNQKSIITTIMLPIDCSFQLLSDGTVESVVDETYEIRTNYTEEQVIGDIIYSGGLDEKHLIPIQVVIPKLKWRIRDREDLNNTYWHNTSKEIWFGDLELNNSPMLEIDLPKSIAGYALLTAKDLNQNVGTNIKNGRVQIQLGAFMDSLRASEGVQEFIISLYNENRQRIYNSELYMVRTKWQVKDFVYNVIEYNDRKYLKISWTDHGRTTNRVLHLWDQEKPWETPIIVNIEDGKSNLLLDLELYSIKSSNYLASFDSIDPWAGQVTESVFPTIEEDSYSIEIEIENYIIKDLELTWLSKNKLVISGVIDPLFAGEEIEAVVIGINRSYIYNSKGTGYVNDKGYFTFDISGRDTPNLSEYGRWLFIRTYGNQEVYQAIILSETVELEVTISEYICNYILDSDYKINLLFLSEGTLYENLVLSDTNAREVLYLWMNGDGEREFRIKKDKHLKLGWKHKKTEGYISIQAGVKCTSCGALLRNQAEWYKEHYPQCNRLIPNFSDNRNALILISWSYGPIFELIKKRYPNTIKTYLTLLSSWNQPFKGDISFDIKSKEDAKPLIYEFLDREKEIANNIWGYVNEY